MRRDPHVHCHRCFVGIYLAVPDWVYLFGYITAYSGRWLTVNATCGKCIRFVI